VTAVVDALGVTLTGERADATEAPVADCRTTAALLSVLAVAAAGGASPAVAAAGDRLAARTAAASAIGAYAAPNPWVRGAMVPWRGVPALPPRSLPCPCRRPAAGAASRPPPPRPPPPLPSPPVLVAPAAGAATRRGTAARVEAARGAVDAPLPADGGGPLGLHVVGGAPAAAAAAAAAAGGAAAGAPAPPRSPPPRGCRSRLTADDAPTPVLGVFSRARCLVGVAVAGPPPVAVGGGGGRGGGGSPAPLPSHLPLPAALVALLAPAGTPPVDPHLDTAARATLRKVAVVLTRRAWRSRLPPPCDHHRGRGGRCRRGRSCGRHRRPLWPAPRAPVSLLWQRHGQTGGPPLTHNERPPAVAWRGVERGRASSRSRGEKYMRALRIQ